MAEIDGIIDKHQSKLLRTISNNYSFLKHKTYYKEDVNAIVKLIQGYPKVIG